MLCYFSIWGWCPCCSSVFLWQTASLLTRFQNGGRNRCGLSNFNVINNKNNSNTEAANKRRYCFHTVSASNVTDTASVLKVNSVNHTQNLGLSYPTPQRQVHQYFIRLICNLLKTLIQESTVCRPDDGSNQPIKQNELHCHTIQIILFDWAN